MSRADCCRTKGLLAGGFAEDELVYRKVLVVEYVAAVTELVMD